jgi:predicted nucleic acid-binding Zn ribbon protein
MLLQCANRKYRQCFSIIAGFICDYEEQVLITDIKSDQHCIICQVSLDQCENLKEKWSTRTHETTQRQIQRQRKTHIIKIDEQWVHDVMNFAWEHSLVNIHETMMIDITHQLFKEMIMHLLTWIRSLLRNEMPTDRKRKDEVVSLSDLDQLNARFRKIPEFMGWRHSSTSRALSNERACNTLWSHRWPRQHTRTDRQ